MKEAYSKIPSNTFKQLGINAGMLLADFDPATGTYNDDDSIIGATTGGISFSASPEYQDWGEDIDNCPKNTKELKRISGWTITCSGNFVTMTPELAERLAAAADNHSGLIVPRDVLDIDEDFRDLWIVGDYSDVNTGNGAGFIAIHIMNALSTTGFQIQTKDKGKMQFAFEFTAHYSIDAQETVPFQIYVQSEYTTPNYILLNNHNLAVTVGTAFTGLKVKSMYPANSTVTWTSSDTTKATVDSDGKITPAAAGSTTITASITVNSVAYTDTCTVVVKAAPGA